MLLLDGKVVGTNSKDVYLSQEDYNKLTDEERNNGSNYHITDGETDFQYHLKNIEKMLGDEATISALTGGTIAGALTDLYNRIGDLSIQVDPDNGDVGIVYNDEYDAIDLLCESKYPSTPERISDARALMGSDEQIKALTDLGYGSLVHAILDLNSKLDALSAKVS